MTRRTYVRSWNYQRGCNCWHLSFRDKAYTPIAEQPPRSKPEMQINADFDKPCILDVERQKCPMQVIKETAEKQTTITNQDKTKNKRRNLVLALSVESSTVYNCSPDEPSALTSFWLSDDLGFFFGLLGSSSVFLFGLAFALFVVGADSFCNHLISGTLKEYYLDTYHHLPMDLHKLRVIDALPWPEEWCKSAPSIKFAQEIRKLKTYTQQCFLHFVAFCPSAAFSATTSSIRAPIPARHSLRATIFSSRLRFSVPDLSFFCERYRLVRYSRGKELFDDVQDVSLLVSITP